MIHRHRPLRILGLLFLLFALIPATVVAQESMDNDNEGFILQISRPATVASSDMVDVVVVIDDDAVIDGEVTDALVVINGTATVNGIVSGDIIVAEGSLILNDGATANNVSLFRSDMTRADTATISGDLNEQNSYTGLTWGLTIFSVVFWIGTTIAILLAGLLAMAIFGPQMDSAARTVAKHPLESAVSGLVTWVLLPILAILTLLTIIGIPVGLGLLLVVIPLLALMGHMVIAYWLGLRVVAMTNIGAGRYLSLVIGLVLLALTGAIPLVGGLVTFVATLVGTGAIVYRLYRRRLGQKAAPLTPASSAMSGPAHA